LTYKQTINFLIEQQNIRELRAWYIRDLANFLRVESGILEKKIDEYLREHSWLSSDGYDLFLTGNRLTPVAADAARQGTAEQLVLDAAQLKHDG